MIDCNTHPRTIFYGALEWWQEHGDLIPVKPPFVEYAEAVVQHDAAWQRSQNVRQARQRLGMG